jgi:hypothetical protein
MIFLAPFAAMLIQLAVSRSREYGADDTGAHWTGNPYALASALAKIDAYSKQRPLLASPSTAHLFIIAPFLGGMSFGSLFSTHPPTAKRIERLTGRPAGCPSQLLGSGRWDIGSICFSVFCFGPRPSGDGGISFCTNRSSTSSLIFTR